MKRVTDRVSNPFGMRAPGEPAVYGYGDANADFHVLGTDAPTHGGAETGVPFTDSVAGERLQGALHAEEVRGRGFLVVPVAEPADREPGDREALVDRLAALLASDYRQTKGVATTVG